MTTKHYSLPTYTDATSNIQVSQFNIHQSLIVETDPSGNHEIYVVIDNTAGGQTVQSAITNEHIALLTSLIEPSVPVDDITIEAQTGFAQVSVAPTLLEAMQEAWSPTITSLDNGIYNPDDGSVTLLAGVDYYIEGWGQSGDMDVGVYEFYANKNIDTHNISLSTSTSTNYFGAGVYENGLWRYSTTMTVPGEFAIIGGNEYPIPATIWFINRNITSLEDEVTIKNIDWIIGRDGSSIDGSFTEGGESNRELVTKGWIEANTPSSDDITLEDINNIPVVVNPADFNDVLHDAWDDNIPNSGWAINESNGALYPGSSFSYLAGVFSIPSGTVLDAGDYHYLLDNNQVQYLPRCDAGYHRVYTNIDFDANGIQFQIDDASIAGSSTSMHHEQVQIFNGMYELTVFVGGGYGINHVRIYKTSFGGSYTLPTDLEIQFIKSNEYPSNKVTKIKNIDHIIDDDFLSIDGTDTPMSDPHRELVTRSYLESNVAQVDNVTVENDTGFQFGYATNSFHSLFSINYDGNSSFQSGVLGNNVTYVDGLLHHASGGAPTDSVMQLNDTVNADAAWSAGTHYIYSTIPLNFGSTLYLQGYKGDANIAFTAFGNHDKLYIGAVIVPAGHNVDGITWGVGEAPAGEYYLKLISTTLADFAPKIKNAEVINIINSMQQGIKDGAPMFHADHELITRQYMEDYVAGSGSSLYARVLDAADIANKYVIPSLGNPLQKYRLSVGGAPFQLVGVDYDMDAVNTDRITWDTLGLDGVLAVGDTLEITYTV